MQVQRISNNNNLCSKGCHKIIYEIIKREHTANRHLIHQKRTLHYYPYFNETNKQISAAINELTEAFTGEEHVHCNAYNKYHDSIVIHEKLPITEQQAKNIAEITGVGTNDLLPMILIQQAIAANKKI